MYSSGPCTEHFQRVGRMAGLFAEPIQACGCVGEIHRTVTGPVFQRTKQQRVEGMVTCGTVHVRLHDVSDFIEYVLNLFRHGLWRILFGLGFQFFGTQYFAFESSARILA